MTNAIELTGLTKRFGSTVAVDSIDLAVPEGAFLVLLGPSGCGKTTTLRMLAGLETPTEGQISFNGKVIADPARGVDLAPGKRDAGMVFQSYALWPHMTVKHNIEWPLKIAKWSKPERDARIEEVLGMLQISELAGRYPSEISGGQQQRVAIARTIAPRPHVLLFDEPLSNLDAKLRVDTRAELLQIHRATGATSVYVTHDQVEAMTMSTHIALLRDGRIEQFGTPDDLLYRPATAFVATFIGTPAANVLPAVAEGGRVTIDGQRVAQRASAPDGPVSVMYRAEQLRPAAGGDQATVTMVYTESSPLAGRYVSTGKVGDTRISIVTPGPAGYELGEQVPVALPDEPAAVFGPDGARIDEEGAE